VVPRIADDGLPELEVSISRKSRLDCGDGPSAVKLDTRYNNDFHGQPSDSIPSEFLGFNPVFWCSPVDKDSFTFCDSLFVEDI
jgi:hypothetical protein